MACISLDKGEEKFLMTKYVGLSYHYFRENVKAGEIKLTYIRTGEKLVDVQAKKLVPKNVAKIMVKIVAKSGVDQESHAGVISEY